DVGAAVTIDSAGNQRAVGEVAAVGLARVGAVAVQDDPVAGVQENVVKGMEVGLPACGTLAIHQGVVIEARHEAMVSRKDRAARALASLGSLQIRAIDAVTAPIANCRSVRLLFSRGGNHHGEE